MNKIISISTSVIFLYLLILSILLFKTNKVYGQTTCNRCSTVVGCQNVTFTNQNTQCDTPDAGATVTRTTDCGCGNVSGGNNNLCSTCTNCNRCSTTYDYCRAQFTSHNNCQTPDGSASYSVDCSCPVVGNSNCPGGNTASCQTPPTSDVDSNIDNLLGGTLTYYGQKDTVTVTLIKPGVYEVKATGFACQIGSPNCEPEKYEISFPKNIEHIFGLGMQVAAKQVEVADFIDTSFGNGHIYNTYPDGSILNFYDSDAGRMRTPIFVLPSEGIIIAYFQPAVKKLRLTRTQNSTQIVLKKAEWYNEGQPAPLLIIKSSTIGEAYKSYYSYLKSKGFYFKSPLFRTFGLHWEAFDEYICLANRNDINNVINKYESEGLRLSSITIGSGYWGAPGGAQENVVGCGSAESGYPATDSLVVSQNRYGGLSGITELFNNLFDQHDIYPLIGMRHRIQQGTSSFNNIGRIGDIFSAYSPGMNPYLDTNVYYGSGNPNDNNKFRMLNLNSNQVISTWVDILKDKYGPFRGIKEDDMNVTDQKQNNNYPQFYNLSDGLISKVYSVYNQKFNDFMIFGRNDWFSVGTDGQNPQGYLPPDAHQYQNSYSGDKFRFILDSVLTQIASGYPHPTSEHAGLFGWARENPAGSNHYEGYIDTGREEEFLRTLKLITFWPVAYYSRGFWHLPEPYQEAAVYFAKLRMRLGQYAFDQAKKWYEEGIPYLMQPLYINYPQDPNVYSLYSYNNDPKKPIDEYMFGNALLVRPQFINGNVVSVYFPAGIWKPLLSSSPSISGGNFSNYNISNLNDYPVFLKEGEILLLSDQNDMNKLIAYVFLENMNESNVYTLYPKSGTGKIRLQAEKTASGIVIKNLDNNHQVNTQNDPSGNGFTIADINSLLNGGMSGDLNHDGKVNISDYNILLQSFGNTTCGNVADIDGNCMVDIFDYNILVGNFGK